MNVRLLGGGGLGAKVRVRWETDGVCGRRCLDAYHQHACHQVETDVRMFEDDVTWPEPYEKSSCFLLHDLLMRKSCF